MLNRTATEPPGASKVALFFAANGKDIMQILRPTQRPSMLAETGRKVNSLFDT